MGFQVFWLTTVVLIGFYLVIKELQRIHDAIDSADRRQK